MKSSFEINNVTFLEALLTKKAIDSIHKVLEFYTKEKSKEDYVH